MDDTELYADLNVDDPDQQEAKTLNLDDETISYLELEVEDTVNVIKSGSADVGDGKLTITQGGVTKGTFTANQKTDVTIALDAGGASEVTKAEFDAEVTRATNAETTNATAISTEETRAKAKEAEIEGKLDDYAPLASPALTGTPTAPTATAGTSTTQIATCAFVADAINTAITEVENGTY